MTTMASSHACTCTAKRADLRHARSVSQPAPATMNAPIITSQPTIVITARYQPCVSLRANTASSSHSSISLSGSRSAIAVDSAHAARQSKAISRQPPIRRGSVFVLVVMKSGHVWDLSRAPILRPTAAAASHFCPTDVFQLPYFTRVTCEPQPNMNGSHGGDRQHDPPCSGMIGTLEDRAWAGPSIAPLMSTSDASTSASDRSLRGLLLLLATIAGVAVANIYYNQPLLDNFRGSFPTSASWVGAVPAVTQLGYAAGMLLLAPLGDRFDRRRLILLQIVGMCVALVTAATAPTLPVLIVASLAIGVLATIAQQAVPFAAELAPPAQRGHAVGTVMSGLLLGILLARTAAGVIAQYLGWRAVFGASVVAVDRKSARLNSRHHD